MNETVQVPERGLVLAGTFSGATVPSGTVPLFQTNLAGMAAYDEMPAGRQLEYQTGTWPGYQTMEYPEYQTGT